MEGECTDEYENSLFIILSSPILSFGGGVKTRLASCGCDDIRGVVTSLWLNCCVVVGDESVVPPSSPSGDGISNDDIAVLWWDLL
jgi:hypothetical protein